MQLYLKISNISKIFHSFFIPSYKWAFVYYASGTKNIKLESLKLPRPSPDNSLLSALKRPYFEE